LRVVLDTCILKLATLPNPDNPSGLIAGLAIRRLVDPWASPAMLEEYADVVGDHPDFLSEITAAMHMCHPVSRLRVIRHEPDNRFLECGLAGGADYLITVNTASGHFDRAAYDTMQVVTPGRFLRVTAVQALVREYLGLD